MSAHWGFRIDDRQLTVSPPASDPTPVEMVRDWLRSDVGTDARGVDDYRSLWEEAFDVSGNGTVQTLDGDEVMFEALYDQWEDFRMPLATFEQILTDYREFLVRRAADRAAGTPPA